VNFNSIEHLFPFVDNLKKSFGNLDYLSMMGNPAAPSFVNGGIFHDYLIYRYVLVTSMYRYLQVTSGIYRFHIRVFTGHIDRYLQVTSTGIKRLHLQVFPGYIIRYLQVTSTGIYRL
jgi:hypothetical protein